jgi:NAD(P)-dependent dehydrogenase (short-subunit alcohol dehydrogenase family)
MKIEGSAAIVTGGAGGLGSAVVRRLSGMGLRVAVFDLDAGRAKELADEVGNGTVGVGGDVTSDDDVAAAIDAATTLGALSVLVNVARGGVGGGRTVARGGIPHEMESFVKTMEMNATGTFNVTRLVAAAMGANEPDEDGQRGVVVNTASIAGMEGKSGQVAYSAAKAAILGMTLPMAWRRWGSGCAPSRRGPWAPRSCWARYSISSETPPRGSSSRSAWAIRRSSPFWSNRSCRTRT